MLRRFVLIPVGLTALLAFTLAMLPGEAPPGDVPRFVDVTAASGIKFVNICGEAHRVALSLLVLRRAVPKRWWLWLAMILWPVVWAAFVALGRMDPGGVLEWYFD